MAGETGTTAVAFRQVAATLVATEISRDVADEVPIAIEFNGIGYAVLMATPTDLVDLAYGFALAERVIDAVEDVVDVDVHPAAEGMLVRVTVVAERVDRIVERVRHRVSESSCGLCGIENLEQAIRPLPPLPASVPASDTAVFRALAALRAVQPLGRATGAVHGAAACAADGTIRLVREDVGRHNAFDKLVGAMARERLAWDNGFALLTSRCSYELVEKAVLARCPLLVTISAPTSLAVARASAAGLALRVLARPDSLLARDPA